MDIFGVSGSTELLNDPRHDDPLVRTGADNSDHDAAVVWLADGEVKSAIEEERLNRIKHANFVAELAFARQAQGLDIRQLHFAFPTAHNPLVAAAIGAAMKQLFRFEPAADHVHFFDHHLAHAASAYYPSSFERSLVITVDGQGNDKSASVAIGEGPSLRTIKEVPAIGRSLGWFYSRVTRYQLGLRHHDEFKVMGLAPYGDPARYREAFARLYTLLPEGEWQLAPFEAQNEILDRLAPPRRRGEEFSQHHKDLAAALQEALAKILFHFAGHYRKATGLTDLCLAGGVAHNCTVNGQLLRSGLFERVFVQPAAHDAGGALGAALLAQAKADPSIRRPQRHVYWGTDIAREDVAGELARWQHFVEIERSDDVCAAAAGLLATGAAIGWVQGRAEFGPRALGNRSILADPRPASNKDVINAMVKKREAFRPFAPAVVIERAGDYFDVRPGEAFPYMTFILDVRPEQRALLGAVTHVDGTARVQTVDQETNPRFWKLISAFAERTGVPVLLNTSFNNNAEPIVDSVFDAVVCLLTTGLQSLVVGDFIVRKRAFSPPALAPLSVALPPHVVLEERTVRDSKRALVTHRIVRSKTYSDHGVVIGEETLAGLRRANTEKPVAELFPGASEQTFDDLWRLWCERLIRLRPTRPA
jgi:carbamoyltransferase